MTTLKNSQFPSKDSFDSAELIIRLNSAKFISVTLFILTLLLFKALHKTISKSASSLLLEPTQIFCYYTDSS